MREAKTLASTPKSALNSINSAGIPHIQNLGSPEERYMPPNMSSIRTCSFVGIYYVIWRYPMEMVDIPKSYEKIFLHLSGDDFLHTNVTRFGNSQYLS